MRNLKISAKIMLGFGIVLALLLVVAVLVTFTNSAAIGNVTSLESDSGLQTLGNRTTTSMQSLRAPTNRMILSMDNVYYEDYQTAEAALRQNIASVYAYIDANPVLEKFRPGIQKAEQEFSLYAADANEMGRLGQEMVAADNQLAAYGAELGSVADVIMVGQIASMRTDIAGLANQADMLRRATRIEEGNAISTQIAAARLLARSLVLGYDGDQAGPVTDAMNGAIDLVTAFRDESQLIANKEAAQTILDALIPYRDNLILFADLCIEKAALADRMPGLIATAQASMDAAMAEIDQAMVNQVSNTRNSAQLALVAVLILSAASLLIGIGMAVYISRLISKPLQDMMGYIKQAGETGNLLFRDDEWQNCDRLSQNRDEIGQTMKAFTQMMRKFVYYGEAVNTVAHRDLSAQVATLGANDTFGNALGLMLDNLNVMFGEINNSTDQVASGSKQIADGAQALAQGSTEQAAAVEQLSASISEIAGKTKENAEMADKAAALSESIRRNAEKGSSQMGQMTQAVKEINDASQAISKVIKTIDDIAFQTNILALNAAVEAARAGQHGKGFAVVAEEVRSLASKSAAAAKDTAELIENSMEKAGLGAKIAGETAASLGEIVSGINESSALVGDIAKSSEEQSLGIAQINKGIDQVAQVVQQNSATAEQSAAAAEEMSGQSVMLSDLVAQFKLKDAIRLASGPDAPKRLSTPEPAGGYGKY